MYNNSILQKTFLYTYFLTFIIILFLRDSGLFKIINTSIINDIYFTTLFCGIMINLLILLCIKNNIVNILLGIGTILLFVCPTFFSSKLLPPVFVLFILVAMNSKIINPRKFIKTDFYMHISLIVIIFTLYYLNILPTTEFGYRNGHLRDSLGFSSPNAFALIILITFISFSLMNYKIKHIKALLVIFIFIYLVTFLLTNSRQFEILGLLFIINYILSNISSSIYTKFINDLSGILLFIGTITSFIISVIFIYNPDINNPLFYWLNSISSNRLLIETQTLYDYPIKLTGYKYMPLISLKGENLDNLFANDLVHCGILGFIIIISIIFICILKSIASGNAITNISLLIVILALLTIYTDELYSPLIYIISLSYYKKYENMVNYNK